MTMRSDAELLEITTVLRDDYQLEAVTAAESELLKRNLSDQQLAEAQALLDAKILEQTNKKEKIKKLQNKVADIADTIHPLKEKSTDTTIKLITIGLSIPYLIFLFNTWDLFILMFQDFGNIDFSGILYIVPILSFPIGLFGFWTIKKYGWIIITILLTIFAMNALISLAFEIKWAMQSSFQYSNPALDELFGKNGFAFHIGQLLLFVGLIYFLNIRKVIEKFKINKRTQLLVIGLTAIPFILFGLSIYL